MPFTAVTLLYIILGILRGPDATSLTAHRLPAGAGGSDREAAAAAIRERAPIDALFLPVRLAAGQALFALGLTFACRAWKNSSIVGFSPVFAAVVYGEVVLFAGRAFAAIAGPGATAGTPVSPPWSPAGMDLVFASADFTVRYVLNSVNPFSAAYVALLAVTLAGATGLARWKAAASAAAAWAVSLGINAAILESLRSEFHFNL